MIKCNFGNGGDNFGDSDEGISSGVNNLGATELYENYDVELN